MLRGSRSPFANTTGHTHFSQEGEIRSTHLCSPPSGPRALHHGRSSWPQTVPSPGVCKSATTGATFTVEGSVPPACAIISVDLPDAPADCHIQSGLRAMAGCPPLDPSLPTQAPLPGTEHCWDVALPHKKSTPHTPCVFWSSQKCSCRLICSRAKNNASSSQALERAHC